MDYSTFPCWNGIKHNSDRKAATCPSHQRTVVCDRDLSKGRSGERARARPGQPRQNFCAHYESPSCLNYLLVWVFLLATTIQLVSLSFQSMALVPKFSLKGANRPSFHWPHSLLYLLVLPSEYSLHLYFSLWKSRWTLKNQSTIKGLKNISSEIILPLLRQKCLDWKPF